MNNVLMSVVETAADVTTVDTLGIMGKGMIGIFIVTAIVVGCIKLLNVTTKGKDE